MNYKEIVEELSCSYAEEDCHNCNVENRQVCNKRILCKQAAKMIEEMCYLLKQYIPYSDGACNFCAHKDSKPNTTEFIENCDVCNEAQHYCCWEYGELSDAMRASMELNEIVKAKLREWRELK